MRLARRGLSFASFCAVAVVVVATLAVDGRATAGEVLAMALDFDAESQLVSCPSAGDFRQEVVRHLGRDPFRADAQRRLVVRFYAARSRMEGRIEWRDPGGQWEGERTFASRDNSCRDMGRAVAFAAAVQIRLMTADDEPPPAPPVASPVPPPPPPPPPVITAAPAPQPPTVAREPVLTVDVGFAATVDAGGGAPSMALARLGFWLGHPNRLSLRVAGHGLGPGAEVSRAEGTAQLGRLLVTADVVHVFRAEHLIQPLVALGVGFQDLRVHGISARPDLASARDGHVYSGLLTTSGGVVFAIASRVALVAEVQAIVFRPSVHIKIAAAEAATLDGLALLGHGGLLARF